MSGDIKELVSVKQKEWSPVSLRRKTLLTVKFV